MPADLEGGAPNGLPSSSFEGQRETDVARREAENGVRQFDLAIDVIKTFLEPEYSFALRPNLILQLQAVAVDGIEPYPGRWRSGAVRITESAHQPPEPHLVEHLVQEMCDYVNDNWHEKTAFHLAAFVMWRVNWIHPFTDGNGRTSRVTAYIVLCTALRTLLPGSPTIPQQIQDDRTTYFRALEDADVAYAKGQIDVSAMETALRHMLATQLLSVIEKADGRA